MEDILKQIEQYADHAHGDQTRKYSTERYIVHPVRVMQICLAYTNDVCVLSAALVHDVLEDTPVTKERLLEFLCTVMNVSDATKTVQLVQELTDVYVKKAYPSWNRRKRKAKEAERIAKTSGESQSIKYADIIDNCPEITERDPAFASRFLRECKELLGKIPSGNKVLYERAARTVDECLSRLRQKRMKSAL